MADLQQIVDQLSDLTVIEAAELSKMLEEKWGVSAAAPVAVAAAGASSTLFLLRSLLPLMSAQKEKATTVVGVVCAMQVIFMLIVKVKFYTSGF